MIFANQTPGGYKFESLVAIRQGRANRTSPLALGYPLLGPSCHVRVYDCKPCSPALASSAAIHFAMRCSAPCSTVLRHSPLSRAAVVHWSALMPKAPRSSRKHPIQSSFSSSKRMHHLGKVANPARGQLNREIDISLSTFAPENLVSRDGLGSPVPRQPAHLHTQAESGAYLRNSSRAPRRHPFICFKLPYAIRSVPSLSGHAIAYRWRSLLESAGTGPVNLKVVPNECCLGRSP